MQKLVFILLILIIIIAGVVCFQHDRGPAPQEDVKVKDGHGQSTEATNVSAMELMMKMARAKDWDGRLAAMTQFIEHFPEEELTLKLIDLKAERQIKTGTEREVQEVFNWLEDLLKERPSFRLKATLARMYALKNTQLTRAQVLAQESVQEARDNYGRAQKDKKLEPEIQQKYLGWSLYALGLIHLKQGDLDQAKKYLAEAAAAMPENQELINYLAQIVVKKGDIRKAFQLLDEILKREKPNDEVLRSHKVLFERIHGPETDYEHYVLAYRPAWKKTSKCKSEGTYLEQSAPDFTINTVDGHEYDLHALRGKTIVIKFFAIWCMPCHLEMPAYQNAVDSLSQQNVQFLVVAIDEHASARELKKYLDQNKYSFQIAINPTMAKAYNVGTIPHLVIIDPQGKIRYSKVGSSGSDDLTPQLAEIFKKIS